MGAKRLQGDMATPVEATGWPLQVALWIAIWSLLHVASSKILPPLFCLIGMRDVSSRLCRGYIEVSSVKRAYWRRLVRSQFYYVAASCVGVALLHLLPL